ncbi:MAG: cadherin-like beta sandwich domain-containing protein [Dysgonamonadaceae bacterium]|jgi:hypothetical protein|nr:cadherin-like beta sandwich domain-containing protein [Dysgonamonadaceae bacterium]
MKKKFLILSAVLLLAGFSAHSAVYDLDYGRDWSYVFVQDAYQWDPGKHNGSTAKSDVKLAAGNLNGSGVNGYDTTGVFSSKLSDANPNYNPAGRNAYLKVTAGPADNNDVEWGKFNTQGEYEMEADETSQFIYLSANIHRADGSNFEHKDGYTYRVPFISVKAYSQNDDVIEVEQFTRGTIPAGVGQIDTLAILDSATYNAAIRKGESTLRLFRANFGGNSSIKIVWEVTYPEGHANHGQKKTYSAIIRKNPNLTKIATLKDLRLYNADADGFPDRHDDEWESDNLLKSYDRDNGVYRVENVSTEGSRLYFETDRPKATVSAKFNGQKYDLATQNATALKYIDIPSYGGLVELTVTAEIHDYTKTYSIEAVPEEPVSQPLPPLQIQGIRLNGEGKFIKKDETDTNTDSTLWISRAGDTIPKMKGGTTWEGTYYRVVTEAGIPYYVRKVSETDSMITTWAQPGFDTLYYYMAYEKDTCFALHPDWNHTAISVGFNGLGEEAITNPSIPTAAPSKLLSSFALTNGVDTFKINDFRPYFKKTEVTATDNGVPSFARAEYNLSVPNVHDQTLVPLVTFADESHVAVKYGHKFSKVTTINDDGSVVLTFSLVAFKDAADKKKGEYSNVKLTSDGVDKDNDIDSVVYEITLVSNQKGFRDVTFRYNSRSAELVELATAYNNSISSYVFKNPVPDSVKTIYIDFDPVAGGLNKPVLIAADFGDVKPVSKAENAYYITLDSWTAGESKVITLVDSAKDGSEKKVNFEVYKAYDLRLSEIKIMHGSVAIFERRNFKDTTEFDQVIRPDFEIGDLLDTKVGKGNGLALQVDKKEVDIKRFLTFDGNVFTFTFRVFREYRDAANVLQEEHKDYIVKLAYPSANADLEYLATSYGDLSPAFDADFTDYEVVFNSAEHTSIRLFAGAEDSNATVLANETGGSRSISASYDLVYDTTYATVVVTASNEITKTYSVKIINLALPSREPGETGINTVTAPAATITTSKGQLNITSPVSEKVYVYSVTGHVISTYNKKAGTINVPVKSLGVTVIKGTSGWVKKVFIK